jgi:hypothetical protein
MMDSRPAWRALFAVLIAACSNVPEPASAAHGLGISNGTTLEVTLAVNGTVVRRLTAGDHIGEIRPDDLPAQPWYVEARSPSGRILASMHVRAGDVQRTTRPDGSTEYRGVATRIDLSCGRLDIWSGPPLLGPSPGPGRPGDCVP